MVDAHFIMYVVCTWDG